jgi:hypothetical protein
MPIFKNYLENQIVKNIFMYYEKQNFLCSNLFYVTFTIGLLIIPTYHYSFSSTFNIIPNSD